MSPDATKARTDPAIFVVSCSDSRLTAQTWMDSWKSQLGFGGDIFEVRCPGGGLALADSNSAFYKSAWESFRLLSATRNFSRIVLAFHEDCAYFHDKYGVSSGGVADDEQRKWSLVDAARKNVASWSPGADIRPLYMTLDHGPHGSHHGTPQGAAAAPAGFSSYARSAAPPPPPPPPPRPKAPVYPVERAVLRSFDRLLEERLLATGETAEEIIAAAEGEAGEAGVVPAWRVERRAREFIDLLRARGRISVDDLRQKTRAFVQHYAGGASQRHVIRPVMEELENTFRDPARQARRTT